MGALVGDGAAEQRVAEAMAWLLGVSSATGMEPGHVRERLDEAWAAYLGALGREQFTVLAIEDVHWAAAAVLDLVDSLADSLAGTRVLLVCTARPELLDERPAWGAGKQNATTLTLGALPLDESEQLLSSLLGGSPVPAPVRERVLAGTAGNPFFVEEMLRMLIDERALEQRGDGWVATERLGSVDDARLDPQRPRRPARPARARRARCAAALLRRGTDVLAAGGRRRGGADGLARAAASSARAGLRRRRAAPVRVQHALTRDVAYGTLPRDERRAPPAGRGVDRGERSDRGLEAGELGAYHFAEALGLRRRRPAGARTGRRRSRSPRVARRSSGRRSRPRRRRWAVRRARIAL